MGFQAVWICDQHWEEEEGRPSHYYLPAGLEVVTGPCYRCGAQAAIPVRRFIQAVTPDDAA